MQPWDTFIKGSTNALGGSSVAAVDPSTGGKNVPRKFTDKEVLQVRRQIDNKLRYGQPVSDEEKAFARKIGAI
jgi:hypothetical protein